MLQLTARRIFVTGGSRGIGRAAALLAAKAGADVAIGYARDRTAALATVRKIESLGRKALAVQADVTNESEIKGAVDRAAVALGGLDGLVVSAGIFEGKPLEEMSLELWNRVLAINLTGTFLAMKAAVPHLKKAGGGGIVIYTSTAGQRGSDTYSAYATSKAGQIIFMRSMARELAPNHIASIASPPPGPTRIWRRSPSRGSDATRSSPVSRLAASAALKTSPAPRFTCFRTSQSS